TGIVGKRSCNIRGDDLFRQMNERRIVCYRRDARERRARGLGNRGRLAMNVVDIGGSVAVPVGLACKIAVGVIRDVYSTSLSVFQIPPERMKDSRWPSGRSATTEVADGISRWRS